MTPVFNSSCGKKYSNHKGPKFFTKVQSIDQGHSAIKEFVMDGGKRNALVK